MKQTFDLFISLLGVGVCLRRWAASVGSLGYIGVEWSRARALPKKIGHLGLMVEGDGFPKARSLLGSSYENQV